MTNKEKYIDHNLINCIILCFVTAIFSLGWVIINDGGIFTLRDDFNVQQIPFTVLMHNTLSEGLNGWCWGLDLGSPFIQGFSFYNLGSPFFWVSLLFPVNSFPYIVGYLYILKYIIAGIFSYLYIKLFVRDPKYAVIGALLYSFSGFQSVNLLFYHFHDVVAFFPLLLYSLELYMEDNSKKSLFVFSVFINCLINYFFFVEECVFLVIYYLFRFLDKDLNKQLKKIVGCGISAIWGIGMAAVLFIPNVVYILGNERSKDSITLYDSLIDQRGFLYILKGLILPGEAMHDHSSVVDMEWSSTAAYLPLVGLSLVFAYLLTKKDWLSKLTGFLITISFIPILSSAFLLFAENNRRWWFTLVLMISLVTTKVLEEIKTYRVSSGVLLNALLVVGFYILIKFVPWHRSDMTTLVYHPMRLMCYCIISLLGVAFIFIFAKLKRQHYRILVSGVMIFSIITTSSTIYFYKRNSTVPETYSKQFKLGTSLPVINEQYRYDINENVLAMTGEAAGLSCFSSTVAYSLTDFDILFDFYSYNIRMDKDTVPGLPELLGAKYEIVQQPSPNNTAIDTIVINGNKYYIMEKEACPIGFKVNSYIYVEDLKLIEQQKRAIALLTAAVVEPDDEKYVDDILNRVVQSDIDFEKTIDEYVAENTAMAVTDFDRSTKGFTCKSDYESDSVIYFTVPYDKGWTALVDGKEVEIIPSGGMMLLPVDAGEHDIEFTYNTPGFKTGATISVIAISIYFVWVVFGIIYRKRKSKVSKKVNQGENIEGKDY